MSMESVCLFRCDRCWAETYTATGATPEGWVSVGTADYCDNCRSKDQIKEAAK